MLATLRLPEANAGHSAFASRAIRQRPAQPRGARHAPSKYVRTSGQATLRRDGELRAAIYSLGTEALAEQERQVTESRSRGATLLAGGAVIASLLAKPVFNGDHPSGAAETVAAALGVIAAGGLLIFVVLLPVPRELGFSVNARETYQAL